MGSSYSDLLAFPKQPRREAGSQVGRVQAGLDPTDWKPFDEVGAGTREVRINDAKGIFARDVRRQVRGSGLRPALLPGEDAGHVEAGQGHCRGALPRRGEYEKRQAMTIDTDVSHVTKPGADLFLKLGFSAAQAKKLHAASRKQIDDTRLLKQQLIGELSDWIAENQLRQADAARILMVSRPRVSDVVNQKTSKFTIDTRVEMLSRVGKPVRLSVR